MIFKSHLLSMILYAFFVSIVLALIRKNEKREQIKYWITLFLSMVVGALLFGWIMYLFTL
jgi:prepilin signal peptidase PulO-like enzyme (type II secretory pathway)